MKWTTLYIGLDVHKDSITIVIAEFGSKGEIRLFGTIILRGGMHACLFALASRWMTGGCGSGSNLLIWISLPFLPFRPQFALHWILEHPAVTCAIPGARRPTQVTGNITASDLAPLSEAAFKRVRRIYDDRIKPMVHQCW